MPASPARLSRTRIAVFQQNGSGRAKIRGLEKYGDDLVELTGIFDINGSLPEIVDEPGDLFPADIEADLVLSFLRHPDLIDHLVRLCQRLDIPIVASGTKTPGAITPFTCCGLTDQPNLGGYGRRFGLPQLDVDVDRRNLILAVRVARGASCGASWEAAERLVGLAAAEAPAVYAREVQYLCRADPSAFDPVSGKSALHYAGHIHAAALRKALAR